MNIDALIQKSNLLAEQHNWKQVRLTLVDYLNALNKSDISPNDQLLFLLLNSCDYFNIFENNNNEKEYFENLDISILIHNLLIKHLMPNEPILYNNLGLLYFKNFELKKSLNAHIKAVELSNFSNPDFLFNLGNIYVQNFDYTNAENCYLKAIKLNNTDASAYFNLSICYAKQNLLNKAIRSVKKAMYLNSNNDYYRLALSNYINALNEQNKQSEVSRYLIQSIDKLNLHIFKNNSDDELNKEFQEIKNHFDETFNKSNYYYKPLPNKKFVTLHQSIGRIASLDLHSLLDGHPNISTLPSIIFSTFFLNRVWKSICPSFSDANWKDNLISNFCNEYNILFQINSNNTIPYCSLPNNSYFLEHILGFRLNKDCLLNFGVNKQSFCEHLKYLMKNKYSISQNEFFYFIHIAYQYGLNKQNENKKLFLYHFTSFDSVTYLMYLFSFYKATTPLLVVCEPIDRIETHIGEYLDKDQGYTLLQCYEKILDLICYMLEVNFSPIMKITKSYAIKYEDIKNNTYKAMNFLLKLFDIENNFNEFNNTFGELKFTLPTSKPREMYLKNIKKYKDNFKFSEEDKEAMKLLTYPISVKYRYIKADDIYSINEFQYKLKLFRLKYLEQQSLFDFEKDIQAELLKDGTDISEIYNIRNKFINALTPYLNYLSQHNNFPCLPELLQI